MTLPPLLSLPGVVLAHHEGAIDPALWKWIEHRIDSVLGLGPETIVVGLGAVLVIVPVAIGVLALRSRRAKT